MLSLYHWDHQRVPSSYRITHRSYKGHLLLWANEHSLLNFSVLMLYSCFSLFLPLCLRFNLFWHFSRYLASTADNFKQLNTHRRITSDGSCLTFRIKLKTASFVLYRDNLHIPSHIRSKFYSTENSPQHCVRGSRIELLVWKLHFEHELLICYLPHCVKVFCLWCVQILCKQDSAVGPLGKD